jgi:hypothetical protein
MNKGQRDVSESQESFVAFPGREKKRFKLFSDFFSRQKS